MGICFSMCKSSAWTMSLNFEPDSPYFFVLLPMSSLVIGSFLVEVLRLKGEIRVLESFFLFGEVFIGRQGRERDTGI